MKKANLIFPIITILISIWVGYGETIHYSFHFDDTQNLVEARKIQIKEWKWQNLTPILLANRPVANMTFAMNYYFGGLQTSGYHLVNILIHAATAIVIYILFLKTLALHAKRESSGIEARNEMNWLVHRPKIAFVSALLWAVHPVQTQAVTYLVQRMTSLAALFYLSSLLAYVYGRENSGWKSGFGFLSSAICALLAFGTKENSLTLPVVILLYELFFISRSKLELSRRGILLFAGVAAWGTIGILYTLRLYQGAHTISQMLFANYGVEKFDPLLRVMTEWRVIFFYLSLLLLPLPFRMNLDPEFTLSRSLFDPFTTFVSLGVILFAIGYVLYRARRHPLLSFAILWFLINLAIESTFINLDLVFEHRLYLPSVMLCLALTSGTYHLALKAGAKWEARATVALAVVAVIFLYLTYERNQVWSTPISLWSDVVAKSPHKARAVNNLGKAYLDAEEWDQAKLRFAEAVNIDPKFKEALTNLGNAFVREARYDLAVQNYQAALELDQNNSVIHNALGVAYQGEGRRDLALNEFVEAVRLDPYYSTAHQNLGTWYLLSNQIEKAKEEFQKTIELNPMHTMAHTNLGTLYQTEGKWAEALEEFKTGLRLNPHATIVQFRYGMLMEKMNQKAEAIPHYQEGIKWASPQDYALVEVMENRLKELNK